MQMRVVFQVYSKVVIIFAACIMIFTAPFTKFIALFITLPDPVLGAVMAILLVLISAVGKYINNNCSRENQYFSFNRYVPILSMKIFLKIFSLTYFLYVFKKYYNPFDP